MKTITRILSLLVLMAFLPAEAQIQDIRPALTSAFTEYVMRFCKPPRLTPGMSLHNAVKIGRCMANGGHSSWQEVAVKCTIGSSYSCPTALYIAAVAAPDIELIEQPLQLVVGEKTAAAGKTYMVRQGVAAEIRLHGFSQVIFDGSASCVPFLEDGTGCRRITSARTYLY